MNFENEKSAEVYFLIFFPLFLHNYNFSFYKLFVFRIFRNIGLWNEFGHCKK